MRPDTLSVILRSASFIALFQATGMAIFFFLFGNHLTASRLPLRRVMRASAIAALAFLIGQYSLEAARMADDISGFIDPSLQMQAMHSASSVVLAVRLLGLVLIMMSISHDNAMGKTSSIFGSLLVCGSFMLTGHTASSSLRWGLAPLLTIHVTIAAFWFGALMPLYLISIRETSIIAAQVTAAFSQIAFWLVPCILIAGSLLGLALVRHLAEFSTDYGLSLIMKFAGFSVLMGLAALNKWRLGPAIATGNARALKSFRRSLCAEYLLIATVLSVTAVMTTLYSPEP